MSQTQSPDKSTPDLLHLAEAYEQCGEHMRFYAEARFKIMTLAVTLAATLIGAQQIWPPAAVPFGFIGLLSTIALFSLESEYRRAWGNLYRWVKHNIEDKWFGEDEGPLHSLRRGKAWYVLRSKRASNLLYFLLLLVWLGNTGFYVYQLITTWF